MSDVWAEPSFTERFGLERDGERTLQLTFRPSRRDAPPSEAVLAQRAHLVEGISEPWHLTVHALTQGRWFHRKGDKVIHEGTQPHAEQFLGHHVRVVIQAEGQSRTFDGVVTAARQLGHWRMGHGDYDGFDLVELVIEPVIALLRLRRHSRVFHDQCPLRVAFDLIEEHGADNACFAGGLFVRRPFPMLTRPRSYLTQYKETDFEFFHRLLASEGYNYLLPNDDQQPFGHYLRLFTPEDSLGREPDVVLGSAGAPDGLPLRHWHSRRRLVVPRTEVSTSDYKDWSRRAHADGRDHGAFDGAGGSLGDYLPLRPNTRPKRNDELMFWLDPQLPRDAAVRQWANDMQGDTFHGETIAPLPLAGIVRVKGPSHATHTRFKGPDRPLERGTADYVVVRQTVTVRVALHPELRQALDGVAPDMDQRLGVDFLSAPMGDATPRVLSVFDAIPAGVPVAPDPFRYPRRAPGAVTATVVGNPNFPKRVVHTDTLGRIAVKMHWQRDDEWRSGHARDMYQGGEPTVWLRYVQPGAGDGIGFQYLPRIGDEVLVMFLDGDPDRPIAVGSLHNIQHKPPAFGGEGALPDNNTLTGLRTREHGGSGGNELCMDDTAGHVGVRLASSTAQSTFTLGEIATPRKNGKAACRGTGFELRTGGAAALRAARGMLLTTFDAAPDAAHVAHDELNAMIAQCHELAASLAAVAQKAGVAVRSDSVTRQVSDHLPPWDASKAEHAPVLAVSAAENLVVATHGSQLSFASKHVDSLAQGHMQHTSGGEFSVASGHRLSLFAADDGIDAIASRGNLSLRAKDADVVAEARQSVSLAAAEGKVRITAPTIELVAHDGSYVRIGNGIEWGTTGAAHVRSDGIRLHAPARFDASASGESEMTTDQQIRAFFDVDSEGTMHAAAGRLARMANGGQATDAETAADGTTEALADTAISAVRASIRKSLI